ncbi:hypothetical protein [Saccharopolyspora sp. NPDC002578]
MPETASPAAIPTAVKIARVVLLIQGALIALGSVVLVVDAVSAWEHGQDVGFLDYLVLILSPAQALALLWCGVRIRSSTARTLAVVVQSIALVAVLLALVTTGALALIGIVVPACVIMLLTRPDVREWYEAETPGRFPEQRDHLS